MKRAIWGILLLLLAGCQGLKRLPEGELLYRGAELQLDVQGPSGHRAALRAELEEVLQPAPNTRLLWSYPGLILHQRAERKPNRKWLQKANKRFGEPAVLLSGLKLEQWKALMANRLENKGYFDHQIELQMVEHGRKARYRVLIKAAEPYALGSYGWLGQEDDFAKLIKPVLERSTLKAGQPFDLAAFEQERQRLDAFLKEAGYYAFSPDYFIFRADTNQGNGQFKLYLSLKKAIPETALKPYRLSEVRLHTAFQVREEGAAAAVPDTVRLSGLQFIQNELYVRPNALQPMILMKPGSLYSRQRELTTTSRLSSMGAFQFVTVRFTLPDSVPRSTAEVPLQADVYLSPLNRRQLRYEAQMLSKSNNFVGPALKVGYQNRNLFKGGELLNVDAKFGFETQFSGGRQTGLNSYELGLKSELVFPRVLAPVNLGDEMRYGLAKTKLQLGFSLLNRMQFYRLRSTNLGLGYDWNTNRFVRHDWQPLAVSFTGLSRTSPAFDTILANNPLLRASFEQRFIAGMAYQFTYNELGEAKRHRWVLLASLDASGNALGLAVPRGGILGEPFAQYVRLDADLRHHWVISSERRLVFRAFAGGGFSYGNSRTLPYIKQYFSGGPSSVRAFNIRSLGPGAYRPANFDAASFFDQAGDIKLEANIEYRFPIWPYVKGAWFADAGNIWLLRPNPVLGGGDFGANWAQELGVGAGFGLRFDFDLLVVRFDLATPLRKPWLPAGARWLEPLQPGQASWRRENLNLVFAIGYPF